MSTIYRCKNVHRAKHYERTIHLPDGTKTTTLVDFTDAQAREAGTILEADGINIVSATRLCEMWTRRGNHITGPRYSYRIPFTGSAP